MRVSFFSYLTNSLDVPAWIREERSIQQAERREAMEHYYRQVSLSLTGNQIAEIIREYWGIPTPTYFDLTEMDEETFEAELKRCELSGLYHESELAEIKETWETAKAEKQIENF
jgi:hypothetical protein